MAGVEAAAREKKAFTLGTTLDAATHVMRTALRSAAVRTVSVSFVGSSQIRSPAQEKHRLNTTDPGVSRLLTNIAARAWNSLAGVGHFSGEGLWIRSCVDAGNRIVGSRPGSILEYRGGFSKSNES